MSNDTSRERRNAVKLTLGLCVVLWLGLATWIVMSDRVLFEQSSLQNEVAKVETLVDTSSERRLEQSSVSPQGDVSGMEQVDLIHPPVATQPSGMAQVELIDDETPATELVSDETIDNSFEARRKADIAALATLADGLRFATGEDELTEQPRERLDRIFETLFLYPDTAIEFFVAGNEVDGAERDRELGELRGEAILDYLEARGIERERLAMHVGSSDGLPSGSHRIRVRVDDANP